jgi:hypothetical protein
MANEELEEAKRVLDQLAREVHGIYGAHAAEAGLNAPKWEELPESAKGISRDISRLILAKMQEAYNEGKKASFKAEVTAPVPKSWSPDDAIRVLDAIKPKLEDIISRIGEERRTVNSPFDRGIHEAIFLFTQKLALETISESHELASKLRQAVEAELGQFLSEGEREG